MWKMRQGILVVIFSLAAQVSSQEQSCQTNNDLPWTGSTRGDDNTERIGRRTQVIITEDSFMFDCHGNVTEWKVDLFPRASYRIALQVWRESSGCYSLVGANTLSTSARGIVTLNLKETPASQIPVEPGDLIGFSVIQAPTSTEAGIIIDKSVDSSPATYFITSDTRVSEATLCSLRPSIKSSSPPVISVSVERSTSPVRTVYVYTSTPAMTSSPSPTSTPISLSSLIPTSTPTTTLTPSSSSFSFSSSDATPRTASKILEPTPTPSPTTPTAATTTASGNSVEILYNSSLLLTSTFSTPVPTTSNNDSGPSTETSIDLTTPMTSETMSSSPDISSSPVGLIAAGIVFVLLSMTILAVAVTIIAVFILRRRKTKTSQRHKVARNHIDNPGYDTAPGAAKLINMTSTEIYENPDTLPLDYSYADVVETKADLNGTYTYIPHETRRYTGKSSQGNGFQQDYDEMEFTKPGDQKDSMSGSKNPFYNALEPPEPPKGRPIESGTSAVYEQPLAPKFSVKKTKANDDIFDSAGIYVPTEKQRTGGHYEIKEFGVYDKTTFFVEDEIYWAPASTTSGLYEQLAAKRYREIPRKQIGKLEVLGKGEFGEVFKSTWAVSGATLEVAVKMLRIEASEEDKVKFLQEAAIMGQFMHPNIVKLYGVVTVGEPVMICLELMKNGDLQAYLKKLDTSEANLQHRFLKFAKEIATGMDYLSRKSFVHRDLAARNILLNDSLTCKIGDFGMARDLMDDTYYTARGGKIPVKWTAPEALFYKKYSTDSDVWSYGMVLFEIWSVGKKPFSEHTNKEVVRFIQDGYCQAPPPGCPRPIYQLMVNCWCPQHENRPIFREICTYLQQPPSQLLTFDLLDSTDSKANTLGEDLSHGKEQYLDLQQKYTGVG